MFAEIRGCSGSRLRWCSLMHSDFESVRIVMSLMMKFWVERGGAPFSGRMYIINVCQLLGRAERSVAPPPMANCYLFARYRYHFRSHGSYTLGKFFLYAEPIY
ncbi:hypothetical protein VTN49DRAFT_2319 [Thermomyces lanuginosus]|uniref:uncharacterized protein n=1 Tax=Thermomyces lanuginosus TaxID=5541 RepID=UPI003742918C